MIEPAARDRLDVEALKALEEKRKPWTVEVDRLRAERNTNAKAVGMAKGRGGDAAALIARGETLTADELVQWRNSIVPTAELALTDHAPFGPSEEACRWCPAAGQCRAQLEWATAQDFADDPYVLSNEEIAAHMVISPATAKTHVSRAMTKLGARDRAQLVVFAYESGLVTPRRR